MLRRLALLLLVPSAACTSSRLLARDEVLDLVRQPNVYQRTLDVDGTPKPIDGRAQVVLHTAHGEVGPVAADQLHGEGEALRDDAVRPPLRLAPEDVQGAEIQLYSPGKTAALVSGIVAPIVAAVVTGLVIALQPHPRVETPTGSPPVPAGAR